MKMSVNIQIQKYDELATMLNETGNWMINMPREHFNMTNFARAAGNALDWQGALLVKTMFEAIPDEIKQRI